MIDVAGEAKSEVSAAEVAAAEVATTEVAAAEVTTKVATIKVAVSTGVGLVDDRRPVGAPSAETTGQQATREEGH